MMSKTAPKTYAAMGKSVSGGWRGFPDHPRKPLNCRPRSVSVGRTENFLIVVPLRLSHVSRFGHSKSLTLDPILNLRSHPRWRAQAYRAPVDSSPRRVR